MNHVQVILRKYPRILGSVGIVLALFIAAVIRLVVGDGAMNSFETTAVTVVDRHLAWADSQGRGDLTTRVTPIREFFSEARMGTRAFAEEALGWRSKWKLVSDLVTSGDEHATFLKERFAALVFSAEALEAVVQSTVTGHVRHLENVDSELLVRLQADLAEVPDLQLSGVVDPQVIRASLAEAVRQAISAVEGELRNEVGYELAGYIAGEILTTATLRLAASSGILTAGAASGTVTFGAGLVVGLIVDAVLSWAYDELFDPAGELSRQLDQTLGALEQQILTGDQSGPGLIQRLQDYGSRRSSARNSAIRSLVLPGSPGTTTTLAF